MAMTEEERFRFDLTGFLVRPAILTADEVAAIVDHIDRIHHDPQSLSAEESDVPGGPTSFIIPSIMGDTVCSSPPLNNSLKSASIHVK